MDEKTPMVNNLEWNGYKKYKCREKQYQANGYVEVYYEDVQCYSSMILIPGV